MWFQRAFIASRGSSVIAVAMDQGDRIDAILNIFLTVKRNILEYCLENRRMDSKYIASILRGVMRGVPNNFATGSDEQDGRHSKNPNYRLTQCTRGRNLTLGAFA